MTEPSRNEIATVGGGCFWCVEAVYEQIKGVTSAVSGYAGGDVADPTYSQVSTGRTGHAEVVQIAFDPDVVSYREILEIFFKSHDPTTLNRQGADFGTQYRSIILYGDEAQRAVAGEVRNAIQGDIEGSVVTEITPLEAFYEAEEYHQDYFANNPAAGYCRIVIQPKLRKLGLEKAGTF